MAKIHFTQKETGHSDIRRVMDSNYSTREVATEAMKQISFFYSWRLVYGDWDTVSVKPEWDKHRCTITCEKPGVTKQIIFEAY